MTTTVEQRIAQIEQQAKERGLRVKPDACYSQVASSIAPDTWPDPTATRAQNPRRTHPRSNQEQATRRGSQALAASPGL